MMTGHEGFAESSHGRDGEAGAALDDDQAAVGPCQGVCGPAGKSLFLERAARRIPLPIAEHQHIRPGEGAASRAGGQRIAGAERLLVDIDIERRRVEDAYATVAGALQVVDGPVAFLDARLVEAGLLELAVDVRREHAEAVAHGFGPLPEQRESAVRNGCTIEHEAVSVEPPGQGGVLDEPPGVGHVDEAQAQVAVGWIGVPEALIAAEVGQARVHAHAGSGGDDEGGGLRDGAGSGLQRGFLVHGVIVSKASRQATVVRWGHGGGARIGSNDRASRERCRTALRRAPPCCHDAPTSTMKPLSVRTTALLCSMIALLSGCPRRGESSRDAGASAAEGVQQEGARAVQCLAEEANGDLLIGIAPNETTTGLGVVVVEGYGVYRLPKGANSGVQIAQGLPKANVRAIVVTPSGALVAATMQGIFVSHDKGASWKGAAGGDGLTAYGIAKLRSGRLLAATNRGLMRSADEGGTWSPVGEGRGEVNVVVEHPTAGVFAGTDKGVIRSADGDNPWEPVGLAKETVLALAVDAGGDLLAGTVASDTATGQSTPGVAVMDEMIGWKGGVFRYTPPSLAAAGSTSASATPPTGKKPAVPGSGKRTDPGSAGLDAGTALDSAVADVDGELEARWKPAGLQNTTIWAIATLPDGAILAASHSRGLNRWDPVGRKWDPVQGIGQKNPVATILVTSSGIWAGSVGGLFRSTDQGRSFVRATRE